MGTVKSREMKSNSSHPDFCTLSKFAFRKTSFLWTFRSSSDWKIKRKTVVDGICKGLKRLTLVISKKIRQMIVLIINGFVCAHPYFFLVWFYRFVPVRKPLEKNGTHLESRKDFAVSGVVLRIKQLLFEVIQILFQSTRSPEHFSLGYRQGKFRSLLFPFSKQYLFG